MPRTDRPVLSGFRPPPALVGRERELGILRERLAAALAGDGSLVLIGGETGIGKTALAETICHEARAQGVLILTGRCFDLTDTRAYGPWLYLFERYLPGDALPAPPVAFAQPGQIGAIESQATFFRHVLEFLKALTAPGTAVVRPTIMLFDDLHWSDPASLDLLRFVAQSVTALPILILITYRSDELTRQDPLYALIPPLVHEAGAARTDLRRLRTADVRALIDARFALSDADATRLVGYLVERTEGNAFFIEELLRTLEDEQVLDRDAGRWRLGEMAGVRIPRLLRQVIDGRVQRLGDEVQRALTVAAVIGQEVPFAVWTTADERDEAVLLEVVERASATRLVEVTPDGARIRFVHALIREVLYEGMSPLRRRVLHRRIGETLAALPNADADAVAHHFQQAGDARAVEWLVRAGERAQRAFAWRTAAERYQAAIALLPESGEGAGERGWLLYRLSRMRRYESTRDSIASLDEALRLAEVAGDRALAALVRWTRGNVRYVGLQEYEALPEVVAAVETIVALPETERARIQTFEPTLAAYPPAGFATPFVCIGRYRDFLAIAEGMPAPLRDSSIEDPITAVGGGRGGQSVYISLYGALGRPAEAFAFARRQSARFRTSQNYYRLAQIIAQELFLAMTYETDDVALRERLATETEEAFRRTVTIGYGYPERVVWLDILVLEGRWDEARPLIEAEASTRNQVIPWLSSEYPGLLARAQGDRGRAWQLVREAVPDGARSEPGALPFLRAQQGQRLAAALCLDAGDLPQAHAWLEAHDHWLAWSGAVLGQSEGQALWAQYRRARGDTAAAYESVTRALHLASEPRQPLALLAAHRLLGELDTAAGRFDVAHEHHAVSLALADACVAPYERALTLLAMADLQAATGDTAAATPLLHDVRAICAPLGAQPTLVRADALRSRLAAIVEPPPTYPAALSAREVEVLRLIAQGRTNREIADTLFLAPGTVNVHVTHIFTKTNTTNRTEAAIFARDHGLA